MLSYFANEQEWTERRVPTEAPPQPPDILIYYNQFKRFSLMPWPGGLSDQPYQLMYELACVDEVMMLRERLAAIAAQQAAEAQKHA